MAVHHLTPPIRGGERSRLLSSQVGPVTQAIRAMRAAEPIRTEMISVLPPDTRELRRRIIERIEADIALLDALDGDPDIEEDDPAGGDIQDEPHDPEEDAGADAKLEVDVWNGGLWSIEVRLADACMAGHDVQALGGSDAIYRAPHAPCPSLVLLFLLPPRKPKHLISHLLSSSSYFVDCFIRSHHEKAEPTVTQHGKATFSPSPVLGPGQDILRCVHAQ